MILRQEPQNPQLYYIVSSRKSQELHKNKFFPRYFWNEKFYFKKTKKLIEYLEGGENHR